MLCERCGGEYVVICPGGLDKLRALTAKQRRKLHKTVEAIYQSGQVPPRIDAEWIGHLLDWGPRDAPGLLRPRP